MSEQKQPYHLSEPTREQALRQIIDELFTQASPGKLKNALWAKYHSLLEQEAAKTQPGDVQEQLAELDSLELAADEHEAAMIETNDEAIALAHWRSLKAAQAQQKDLVKSLEEQGLRVLIDAERPPFRHSVSG